MLSVVILRNPTVRTRTSNYSPALLFGVTRKQILRLAWGPLSGAFSLEQCLAGVGLGRGRSGLLRISQRDGSLSAAKA